MIFYSLREGTLFIEGGGGVVGLELQRLLNLCKTGEGLAFRFRKHNICKISNEFSAIQGAHISKFHRVTHFVVVFCEGSYFSFAGLRGRVRTLEETIHPNTPPPPPTPSQ